MNTTAEATTTVSRAPVRARSRLHPLSPVLYLWRNPAQTVPLGAVIVMSVLLIAGIVAMLNSIPHAIRTVYGYSKAFAVVWPRADRDDTRQIRAALETAPDLGRLSTVRITMMRVKTIVGQWPFVIYGLEQKDIEPLLERMRLRLAEGRFPKPGAPEIVVSRAVAHNKGYRLGQIALRPDNRDEYAPEPTKVVGILDGPEWFAFSSTEFIKANFFPDTTAFILMADEAKNQPRLDSWVLERMEGTRGRVFSYAELNREAERDLATLYLILNIVIAALVTVLASMMGLLANIHFTQRIVEFGLLQAIGHTRRSLLVRTMLETVLVVIGAWILGILFAHLGLDIVKRTVMEPKGYPMSPAGWETYRYTLSVPVAVALFGLATVWWRFRRFDPVAIVERRLV